MNDFSLSYLTEEKCVNYFGKLLVVPEKCKYLATDLDGSVWAWLEKPKRYSECFYSEYASAIRMFYIGYVDYTGNWKDSLMEIQQ